MPVVFSDWEAVNAGPALWDLAYLTVLSQRSEQRRQRQPSLLGAYLAALRRHGAPPEHCERVSCHDIAAIWVAFFSRWQRYRC